MRKNNLSLLCTGQRGTVLPVVLAIGIGVAALTAGYQVRQLRENDRSEAYRYREEALYEALGQLELVAYMINTSEYDGLGSNLSLKRAIDRADNQFIDADGWPTGVFALDAGGGYFEIVSEGERYGQKRRVSALVAEQQSFADFNYFVDDHPLGIMGGNDDNFPWADAPEGSLHSNDTVEFLGGADKNWHFRDAVTAVNGFVFTGGTTGPADPVNQNVFFHGPTNDAAKPVTGLTDVSPPSVGQRADTLLNLDGEWDYAMAQLNGDRMLIEHWVRSHWESNDVIVPVDIYRDEVQTVMVDEYAPVQQNIPILVDDFITEDYLYEWDEPVYGPVDVWVTSSTNHYRTTTVMETWVTTTQVFHEGGSGGAAAGGGSGTVGWWETVQITVTGPVDYQVLDWVEDTSHWESQQQIVSWNHFSEMRQRQVPNGSHWEDNWVWVNEPTGNQIPVQTTVSVYDHTEDQVQTQWTYVPTHKVQDHDLPAMGSVYVTGDIYMDRMRVSSGDAFDVHMLDGRVTLASNDDILIRDSIVYADQSGNDGTWHTAYLNGDDRTKDYKPNPAYKGNSVLGLIARDDVEYRSEMPDQSEVNGALLAVQGQIRVYGTYANSDGSVHTWGSGFLKQSLRRLGAVTSNHRPVTVYLDGNNAITRGFVFGKSVYDKRMRAAPPTGFPLVNRPRVLSVILKEVK